MPAQSTFDSKDFDLKDIARRWHGLAERRLANYDDLYRSGRWTRYYPTQELFAARMLDVIKVAKAYQKMVVDSPSVVPQQKPPHQEPLRSAPLRREPLRPAA
jgi:hypothetical protein